MEIDGLFLPGQLIVFNTHPKGAGATGQSPLQGTAPGLRPKIKTKAYTSIHKKKEIHIKSGMIMLSGNVCFFSLCTLSVTDRVMPHMQVYNCYCEPF